MLQNLLIWINNTNLSALKIETYKFKLKINQTSHYATYRLFPIINSTLTYSEPFIQLFIKLYSSLLKLMKSNYFLKISHCPLKLISNQYHIKIKTIIWPNYSKSFWSYELSDEYSAHLYDMAKPSTSSWKNS